MATVKKAFCISEAGWFSSGTSLSPGLEEEVGPRRGGGVDREPGEVSWFEGSQANWEALCCAVLGELEVWQERTGRTIVRGSKHSVCVCLWRVGGGGRVTPPSHGGWGAIPPLSKKQAKSQVKGGEEGSKSIPGRVPH